MIKMIVTDIDGTIYSPKNQISPEVKSAIQTAQNKQVVVSIASGRNAQSITRIINLLGVDLDDTLIIGQNGAEVFSLDANQTVHREYIHVFSKVESDWIFNLAYKYNLSVFSYNTDPKYAFVTRKYSVLTQILSWRSRRKPVLYSAKTEFLPFSVMKMIIRGRKKNLADFRKFIEKQGFPSFDFSYSSVQSATLEVNPRQVDKAEGIKYLAQHLHIELDEILYFGDGDNDINTLKLLKNSVAMGNAPEKVKQAAHFVTKTLDENGVAAGIYQFLNLPSHI